MRPHLLPLLVALATCLHPAALLGQLTVASGGTLYVGPAAATDIALQTEGDLQLEKGGMIRIAGLVEVMNDAQLAGSLEFPVTGQQPGTGHGQINLGGQATLSGELTATTPTNYEPSGETTITLVDAGSLSGNFQEPTALPAGKWQIEYTDTQANLVYGRETVSTTAMPTAALFSLYPNPAGHSLYLSGQLPSSPQYRVVDAMGRAVMSGTVAKGSGQPRIDLPASLPNGLYMLQFEGLRARRFEVIR
ncbi:T9SS type A sorting domain-containing protein [Lewinella sp. IMCC34191]|uniref:T9SS type A sorting domain-containing protein n=1 Tax=Lewinella sp. IMCC34191 TaxID=2259172 RepID=UPI000E221A14|nr:T9SS type A sorting domain-containing protein [Lewinella sp. IMCC34191]